MALSDEQDLDRSQPATPHRLAEARRRGEVARSTEVVSGAILMTAALALSIEGVAAVAALTQWPRALWTAEGFASAVAGVGGPRIALDLLGSALVLVAPALAAVMAVSVAASMVQTGPVWSGHPLAPDFARLLPSRGLKRLFSRRSLFEALRATLKILVLSAVLAFAVQDLLARASHAAQLLPVAALRVTIGELARLAVLMAAVLCVLALADLIWTRREYSARLRMSTRELRDEFRHREGDPRIRARMRALRREMLSRLRHVGRTAQADLVVVNPVHVAVALRYRHGEMAAPVVVSKGTGAVAAVIRGIAARRGSAVLRSPMLARRLHARARLDAAIPPEFYVDVARLVAWAMNRRPGRPAQGGE